MGGSHQSRDGTPFFDEGTTDLQVDDLLAPVKCHRPGDDARPDWNRVFVLDRRRGQRVRLRRESESVRSHVDRQEVRVGRVARHEVKVSSRVRAKDVAPSTNTVRQSGRDLRPGEGAAIEEREVPDNKGGCQRRV